MHWLDQRGIDYEPVDVIADESAFDEMIRLSGQELAPVIEVDGHVLADFGPDQLEAFWKKLCPATVQMTVTRMHGGKPWMTEFDNKYVRAAVQGHRALTP